MSLVQVVCRDVAYDLIPVMQRRSLHARLAGVLASTALRVPVPPSTIAYHWAQSCKSLAHGLADVEELPRVLKVHETLKSKSQPHSWASNVIFLNISRLVEIKSYNPCIEDMAEFAGCAAVRACMPQQRQLLTSSDASRHSACPI